MANEKNKLDENQNRQKPDSNANSQPMPEEYSNEANHKGAVDLGTKGTKATASQQQGQGAWNAKNATDQGNKNKNNKDE